MRLYPVCHFYYFLSRAIIIFTVSRGNWIIFCHINKFIYSSLFLYIFVSMIKMDDMLSRIKTVFNLHLILCNNCHVFIINYTHVSYKKDTCYSRTHRYRALLPSLLSSPLSPPLQSSRVLVCSVPPGSLTLLRYLFVFCTASLQPQTSPSPPTPCSSSFFFLFFHGFHPCHAFYTSLSRRLASSTCPDPRTSFSFSR